MFRGRVYGENTLDARSADDRALVRTVVDDIAQDLEPRDHVLARTATLDLITDDNMGTEWRLAPRYRF
jgi:hypothetical protein